MKFYPYKKGGRKRFSHAEGGGGTNSFWGIFLCSSLKFYPYCLRGREGARSFQPLKVGGAKSFTLLRGWGRKKFRSRVFPILYPRPFP